MEGPVERGGRPADRARRSLGLYCGPMRSPSPLERARRLLGTYLEGQGLTVEDLAARLRRPLSAVQDRLSGRTALDLEWLDKALAALEVAPLEFFGRLYAPEEIPEADAGGAGEVPPSAAPGSLPVREGGSRPEPQPVPEPEADPDPEEVFTREEVEALVAEVRALIRGATRMIEARELAREEAGDEDPDREVSS